MDKDDRDLDFHAEMSMKKLIAISFGNSFLSKIERDNSLGHVGDDAYGGYIDGIAQFAAKNNISQSIVIGNSNKKRKGSKRSKK